ncbi:hypothetical protein EV361DRAFT_873925 [Lentinula raphanica]|nr:hypothetical protein EV361DRAFT_873925 [Lentinula raphanica]
MQSALAENPESTKDPSRNQSGLDGRSEDEWEERSPAGIFEVIKGSWSERVVCLPKETCPDSSTGYVPPVYILNQRRFCNPKLQSREAFQLMSGNCLLTVAELLELGRGVQIRKRWPIVYCSMEEIQAFAARVIEQRFFRKLDVDEGDHTRNADNPSFVDCSLPTPLHHADNSNGFLPASCHISLKTHQLPILVNGLVLSRMTYLTLELPSPQISGLSAHEGILPTLQLSIVLSEDSHHASPISTYPNSLSPSPYSTLEAFASHNAFVSLLPFKLRVPLAKTFELPTLACFTRTILRRRSWREGRAYDSER